MMYTAPSYHQPQHHHQPPPPLNLNPPPAAPMHAQETRAASISGALIENFPPVVDHQGRYYRLEVMQQPQRARMCGFGDKDRRPITPPPCVKLTVYDHETGHEISSDNIEVGFLVLTVDLWSAAGDREMNIVRHSATSPSISTAVSSAYPQAPSAPSSSQNQGYNGPNGGDPYAMSYTPVAPQGPTASYAEQHSANFYGAPPGGPVVHTQTEYYPQQRPSQVPTGGASMGTSTRNLIGSLSASAAKLIDPHGRPGIWFVLQDLSVRSEGLFRLKMNFVDVGKDNTLNTGSAPILARCFSDSFQVFSAKKFPGVIESTLLSKCFANQGVKIPIRKEGPKNIANRDEYDEDQP